MGTAVCPYLFYSSVIKDYGAGAANKTKYFLSVEVDNVVGYVLENVLDIWDEESLDGLLDELVEKLLKRFRYS